MKLASPHHVERGIDKGDYFAGVGLGLRVGDRPLGRLYAHDGPAQPAKFELDGPFTAGSHGTTRIPGQEPRHCCLREVNPTRSRTQLRWRWTEQPCCSSGDSTGSLTGERGSRSTLCSVGRTLLHTWRRCSRHSRRVSRRAWKESQRQWNGLRLAPGMSACKPCLCRPEAGFPARWIAAFLSSDPGTAAPLKTGQ